MFPGMLDIRKQLFSTKFLVYAFIEFVVAEFRTTIELPGSKGRVGALGNYSMGTFTRF